MKFNKIFLAIGTLAMMAFVASCSSDNNDEPESGKSDFSKLEKPQYADTGAKYQITTPGSDISSIELTESGRYIITRSWAVPYRVESSKKASALRAPKAVLSRSGNDAYVIGSYIKVGENEYILDGYGSVVITGSADGAVELIVSPEDGESFTVGAMQEDALNDDSDATLALCRSWIPVKLRARISLNGKVMADESGNYSDCNKIFERIARKLASYDPDEYDEDDFFFDEPIAQEIIFTRSGSYVVLFDDGELDARIWKWINRDNLSIAYSYSITDFDDPDESGICHLTFNDHNLTVFEKHIETDSEDGEKMTVTAEFWISMTEKR